jgi:hypothetical protein
MQEIPERMKATVAAINILRRLCHFFNSAASQAVSCAAVLKHRRWVAFLMAFALKRIAQQGQCAPLPRDKALFLIASACEHHFSHNVNHRIGSLQWYGVAAASM